MSGPIVCATRGGRVCRVTQQRAIELAKGRGDRLIFLFVADPSFAGPVSDAVSKALDDELERLGKFLLYVAQRRAEEQGVEAEVVVRHGPVQPSIEAYVKQVGASTLVVGAPQTCSVPQTFNPDELDDFASEIERATDVPVVIVE